MLPSQQQSNRRPLPSTTAVLCSQHDDEDSSNAQPTPVLWSSETVLATIALCTCSLIHAFLLISVFPYSGYMAMTLIPSLTTETVGPYAGMLASAFMAGRTFSAYPFGRMADVYGRVFVLVLSLILSAIFSILFGMSHQSFAMAMLWRFLLGLSNGIVGTVKTVVSELAAEQQPETNETPSLETRLMGMVVGMRAWGFLISPAIGGWLAEPIRQYPYLFHGSSSRLHCLEPWLTRYPFILPNLVGALLCIFSALLVIAAIDETLTHDKRRSVRSIPEDCFTFLKSKFSCCCCDGTSSKSLPSNHSEKEDTPLLPKPVEDRANSSIQQNISLACDTTTSNDDPPKHDNQIDLQCNNDTTMTGLWKNTQTRKHLIAYWLFSFAVVCLDESFPLFCISAKGGLGLSEGAIGQILSTAGLFFALSQYAIYVQTVDRFGLYPSLWIGCTVGFLPVLFIPLSLGLNKSPYGYGTQEPDGISTTTALQWSTFLFLMIIMAVSKVFCCMFFSSVSIALNKTVDATQRAALNGLATLGGSIAKGAGPIVAGVLVSVSYSSISPPCYGSVVIFTTVALLGLAVTRTLLGLQTAVTQV
ncbi:ZINC INDUCED FACILITATOR [Seminavis robusta]|uniref:ZINC INDUCED FACILITATOR n=1 Tax=Seminavis robusta TaxID=568900 RepID=A0A9N8D9B6_9STRA|nr:ZINC INDUCED FACILITATOR [Seminavis robusta]|eukprot:Sro22_g015240.1 ZINC INDUCED FACILITATOR (587) ;mRNA; f:48772-50532